MVKRSRDQSHEAPSRRSWFMIMPPEVSFHAHTRFRNSSRPERAAIFVAAGLGQLALHHHLRGDAGVIRARLPEHALAAQPLEADQHVLQRVVERMADMQRTGDVGRGDDDAEGVDGWGRPSA